MNSILRPIQVVLHPAMALGRGAGVSRSSERSFGVMTHKQIGQTAPAESGATGTPRSRGGAGGFSTNRVIGLAAAAIGLGAGATQLLVKNPKLTKIAFWTELAAIAVLAGVAVGIPGMGGQGPSGQNPAPAPTTSV